MEPLSIKSYESELRDIFNQYVEFGNLISENMTKLRIIETDMKEKVFDL